MASDNMPSVRPGASRTGANIIPISFGHRAADDGTRETWVSVECTPPIVKSARLTHKDFEGSTAADYDLDAFAMMRTFLAEFVGAPGYSIDSEHPAIHFVRAAVFELRGTITDAMRPHFSTTGFIEEQSGRVEWLSLGDEPEPFRVPVILAAPLDAPDDRDGFARVFTIDGRQVVIMAGRRAIADHGRPATVGVPEVRVFVLHDGLGECAAGLPFEDNDDGRDAARVCVRYLEEGTLREILASIDADTPRATGPERPTPRTAAQSAVAVLRVAADHLCAAIAERPDESEEITRRFHETIRAVEPDLSLDLPPADPAFATLGNLVRRAAFGFDDVVRSLCVTVENHDGECVALPASAIARVYAHGIAAGFFE